MTLLSQRRASPRKPLWSLPLSCVPAVVLSSGRRAQARSRQPRTERTPCHTALPAGTKTILLTSDIPKTVNRVQLQTGQRAVGRFFFSFNLGCLSLNQQACSNDRIRLWLKGGIHWCGLRNSACHTPGCTSSLSRASAHCSSQVCFPHR